MAFGNDNVRKASEMKMSREERLRNRKASMTSRSMESVTEITNKTIDQDKVSQKEKSVSSESQGVNSNKTAEKAGKVIVDIEMDLIDLNEDNSKIFGMGNIGILAKTIEEEGFRGAIEIFRKADGRYEIISGHRRYLAQKQLGKNSIPAIVEDMPDDVTKATLLLSSNINNRDLTAADRARMVSYYYNNVLLKDGWREKRKAEGKNTDRQEACAEFFGYSITNVKRYKALGDLEEGLQQFLAVEGFPYTAFDGLSKKTKEEQKKVRDGLFAELRKALGDSEKELEKILDQLDSFPLSHKETLAVINRSLKQNVDNSTSDSNSDERMMRKLQLANFCKGSVKLNKLLCDIINDFETIEKDEVDLTEIDGLIEKLNELKDKVNG